jgi:hypothetical protein
MKYKRNQYTEGVSICALIIAGVFLWWGISILINGRFWNPAWWIGGWWGFLWLGIGLSIAISQLSGLNNRSKLRNVVKNEITLNPKATVEQIARNTGISIRDVRAIILDLKANGELMGKFSQDTGQMEYTQVSPKKNEPMKSKTPESEQEDLKANYCPNCGTPVTNEEAQFCQFCGSRLLE